MRKKQFLQFRRAMATLLAVAMIGQNTVMTTAENYVADNTAVVAEEQAQEPGVQVEESASPAVQESAPVAETPAEPAAQAVAETPAEPAAQAVAETLTERGGAGSGRDTSGTSGAGSGGDTSGTSGASSVRKASGTGSAGRGGKASGTGDTGRGGKASGTDEVRQWQNLPRTIARKRVNQKSSLLHLTLGKIKTRLMSKMEPRILRKANLQKKRKKFFIM